MGYTFYDSPSLMLTSESVTEGHPDKLCDQVSDAVLDATLAQDPMSRVACEAAVTTGVVFILGEITTQAYVDFQQVVRDTVREIGYDDSRVGFDWETCGVISSIKEQSGDIAQGVNRAHEVRAAGSEDPYDLVGAGDQGMMIGFACDETEEYLPLTISPRAPPLAPPRRAAQGRHAALPPPRRQVAGHDRVRARPPEAHRRARRLHAARPPTSVSSRSARTSSSTSSSRSARPSCSRASTATGSTSTQPGASSPAARPATPV